MMNSSCSVHQRGGVGLEDVPKLQDLGKKHYIAVITAQRSDADLAIIIDLVNDAYGAGDFTFTTEKIIRGVTINGDRARRLSPQGIAVGAGRTTTWGSRARTE